jgi:hypothetical protein
VPSADDADIYIHLEKCPRAAARIGVTEQETTHKVTFVCWTVTGIDGLLYGWLSSHTRDIPAAVGRGLVLLVAAIVLAVVAIGLWDLVRRIVKGTWPETYGPVLPVSAILMTIIAVNEILYQSLVLGHR